MRSYNTTPSTEVGLEPETDPDPAYDAAYAYALDPDVTAASPRIPIPSLGSARSRSAE